MKLCMGMAVLDDDIHILPCSYKALWYMSACDDDMTYLTLYDSALLHDEVAFLKDNVCLYFKLFRQLLYQQLRVDSLTVTEQRFCKVLRGLYSF